MLKILFQESNPNLPHRHNCFLLSDEHGERFHDFYNAENI